MAHWQNGAGGINSWQGTMAEGKNNHISRTIMTIIETWEREECRN